MKIAIAGPYSAPEAMQRQNNLDALNKVAAELYRMGHVPVIGVNAALPVVQFLNETDKYEAIMAISLAVVADCDALLLLAESPGANRERDLMLSLGKKVFDSLDAIH